MIRAVAILFHKIDRLFDHKCDMRRVGNRCRLLECQMTIAQNLLILRKPHQVKKHKVKLLSRVLKKPRLILLHAPPEELVRVAEIPVHRRLRNRVGHRLMLIETLIDVIYHDSVFLRKRPRNGRLAAAGRACDKVHIFQILFNYIVLEYHNLSPFESIVSFMSDLHSGVVRRETIVQRFHAIRYSEVLKTLPFLSSFHYCFPLQVNIHTHIRHFDRLAFFVDKLRNAARVPEEAPAARFFNRVAHQHRIEKSERSAV